MEPGVSTCCGDVSADGAAGAVAHAFSDGYERATSAGGGGAGRDTPEPTYIGETAEPAGGDVIVETFCGVGVDMRSTLDTAPLVTGAIGATGGDPEMGVAHWSTLR